MRHAKQKTPAAFLIDKDIFSRFVSSCNFEGVTINDALENLMEEWLELTALLDDEVAALLDSDVTEPPKTDPISGPAFWENGPSAWQLDRDRLLELEQSRKIAALSDPHTLSGKRALVDVARLEARLGLSHTRQGYTVTSRVVSRSYETADNEIAGAGNDD